MYQSEAMWISFSRSDYPFAVKVATGKIDATTGEAWSADLTKELQNYLVLPTQPWLDGFAVKKGVIRQFVAMPLGSGYSTEEQITGLAEHGGLQIQVYPMRADIYRATIEARRREESLMLRHAFAECAAAAPAPDMGLAPGGKCARKSMRINTGSMFGIATTPAAVSSTSVTRWYGRVSPVNVRLIRRQPQKAITPPPYRGSITTGTMSPH